MSRVCFQPWALADWFLSISFSTSEPISALLSGDTVANILRNTHIRLSFYVSCSFSLFCMEFGGWLAENGAMEWAPFPGDFSLCLCFCSQVFSERYLLKFFDKQKVSNSLALTRVFWMASSASQDIDSLLRNPVINLFPTWMKYSHGWWWGQR